MVDPDGERTDAILVASPPVNAKHVLAITCVAIPGCYVFVFSEGSRPTWRNTASKYWPGRQKATSERFSEMQHPIGKRTVRFGSPDPA